MIREWRQRRHLSQLELANRAEVSTRHLSYIENGRSRPTSAMVMRLCDHLEVPLREQNELLLAAGHAPAHPEHSLADPPMAEANAALEAILQAHGPYPALVVDRHWELVTANEAAFSLLDGIDEDLLEPPVNVIRLSVHPRGLAPRIVNLAEWRGHLLDRLRREVAATADGRLAELLAEVEAYPRPLDSAPPRTPHGAIAVPLVLRHDERELTFFSTVATFGTAVDVTVAELSIEAFFPADAATAAFLHKSLPER